MTSRVGNKCTERQLIQDGRLDFLQWARVTLRGRQLVAAVWRFRRVTVEWPWTQLGVGVLVLVLEGSTRVGARLQHVQLGQLDRRVDHWVWRHVRYLAGGKALAERWLAAVGLAVTKTSDGGLLAAIDELERLQLGWQLGVRGGVEVLQRFKLKH